MCDLMVDIFSEAAQTGHEVVPEARLPTDGSFCCAKSAHTRCSGRNPRSRTGNGGPPSPAAHALSAAPPCSPPAASPASSPVPPTASVLTTRDAVRRRFAAAGRGLSPWLCVSLARLFLRFPAAVGWLAVPAVAVVGAAAADDGGGRRFAAPERGAALAPAAAAARAPPVALFAGAAPAANAASDRRRAAAACAASNTSVHADRRAASAANLAAALSPCRCTAEGSTAATAGPVSTAGCDVRTPAPWVAAAAILGDVAGAGGTRAA